jgi:hypothetical protein
MSDPELERRAREAQEKADRSQSQASNQDAAAGRLEAQRDAAVSAASQPDATQAQRDEAVQRTIQAATAREAANKEQAGANEDQANALRASIAAAQAEVREAAYSAEHKVNGFYLSTLFNFDTDVGRQWKALILQNMQIKCVGPENKKVCGFTLDGILGMKSEICVMSKASFIVPIEHKFVGGISRTTITGIKHDSVGGAKWDQQVGVKRETHIGHKATAGPAETTKYPEREGRIGRIMTKGLSRLHKIDKEEIKAVNFSESLGSRRRTVNSLTKTIESLKLRVKGWTQTAKTFTLRGKQITLAFKSGNYNASFSADLKGGSAEGKVCYGVKLQEKGGAKVDLSSSFLFIDGEMIRLN